MTDVRIMELMNQEIDGVNSPAESRELQDHFADHPESRRLFGELTEAVGIFARVTPLDPPPGLQEKILASTPPPLAESRDWRTGLKDFFSPVLRPAVAASFALGLLAGFLVLEGYRGLDGDSAGNLPSHLQGMAGHDRDTLSSAPAVVRTMVGPQFSGRVRVLAEGPRAVIELAITSAEILVVQVHHPEGWSGTGFGTLAGRTENLRVTGGTVSFQTTGAGRWEVHLLRNANANQPVTIQIYHKGELVTEQTVSVKP